MTLWIKGADARKMEEIILQTTLVREAIDKTFQEIDWLSKKVGEVALEVARQSGKDNEELGKLRWEKKKLRSELESEGVNEGMIKLFLYQAIKRFSNEISSGSKGSEEKETPLESHLRKQRDEIKRQAETLKKQGEQLEVTFNEQREQEQRKLSSRAVLSLLGAMFGIFSGGICVFYLVRSRREQGGPRPA